jgi:hypothetical protein
MLASWGKPNWTTLSWITDSLLAPLPPPPTTPIPHMQTKRARPRANHASKNEAEKRWLLP